jgi:hypothetical protein
VHAGWKKFKQIEWSVVLQEMVNEVEGEGVEDMCENDNGIR